LTARVTASTSVTESLSGLTAATMLPSGETATNEAATGPARIGLDVDSGVALASTDWVTGSGVGDTATVVTATTVAVSPG